MGIKNFFKIAVKHFKEFENIGKRVTLNDFSGKTLAIDASLIIYSSALAFHLSDENSVITSHLHVILNKILLFKKHNINQLWIFDNKEPHPLKEEELDARNQNRTFTINAEIVADTQKLLTNMGITYVVAPPQVEAEHLGALLIPEVCDAVLSGDSDVLLFGGNLLRPRKEKNKTIYYYYDFNTFLEHAEITYDELVKIGVAMGSDFNKKIKGIGMKTVLDKIKNNDFEELIKNESDEDKARKYEVIALFKSRPQFPLDKTNGSYNKENVIKMLSEKDFNVERLNKLL
jgi:5'-3' exonuclease